MYPLTCSAAGATEFVSPAKLVCDMCVCVYNLKLTHTLYMFVWCFKSCLYSAILSGVSFFNFLPSPNVNHYTRH